MNVINNQKTIFEIAECESLAYEIFIMYYEALQLLNFI
jgi:hypothetical protein